MTEHGGEYETEHATFRPIAEKLGIATPESLHQCVRPAEVDPGSGRG